MRKKEVAAFHHTIAYRDKNRIWKELLNGKHLYGRSLLYRMHIFNPNMYRRLLRNDYTLMMLGFTILLAVLTGIFQLILLYVLIVLLRSKLNLRIFIYFLLRDLLVLFGFFMFIPKRKFNIQVEDL